MKYFAYGSNMLKSRLTSRCPNALFLSSAVLVGYALRFNKKSCKDGSGKCNIIPASNSDNEVLGILYEIGESDFIVLDKIEGGYSREQVSVKSPDIRNEVETETYIAKPHTIDESIVPYEWYKALVIAGALEHDFPEQYINMLKQFPSKRDQDDERRDRELKAILD